MATAGRPAIVNLSEREIQEIGRACNVVSDLYDALEQRPAGGFDPVRMPMLKDLADYSTSLLESGATGRKTLRQILGTVETYSTTAARQRIVMSIGPKLSRDDLQLLGQITDKVAPPQPGDVANNDLRHRINTDPFRQDTTDLVTKAAGADYDVGFNESTVSPQAYEGDRPCGAVPDPKSRREESAAEAFAGLAVDMAKAVGESKGVRAATADDARTVVRELEMVMNNNRCYTETDRRRLKAGAKRAARLLEDTGNEQPIRVAAQMADWTDYREYANLTRV